MLVLIFSKTIENINEIACRFYNNHNIQNDKKKKVFQKNDKICLKKNGMVVLYAQEGENGPIKPVKKGSQGDLEEEIAEGAETTIVDQTMLSTQEEINLEDAHQIRLCNGEIFFVDQVRIC